MLKQIEWDLEKIKKFWDYQLHYNRENYFSFLVGKGIVKKFRKYIKKSSYVLDYGCGPGFLIEHLLKENIQVMGIDYSDNTEVLQKVKAQFKNYLGTMLIENIDKINLKFDLIFLIEVIEHVEDDELNKILKNCKNLLNDNGILIITTPNNENLNSNLVFCPVCETVFHNMQHVRSWSKEKIRNYFNKQGFKVLETDTTDFAVFTNKNYKASLKYFVKKLFGFEFHHLYAVLQKI